MPNVNDPTLAGMAELAHSEYRVRVTVMQTIEYKIWAHDEQDAVNKVKDGQGREVQKSQPEVAGVQVGLPGGALTQSQASETARIIENARTQKDRHVETVGDAVGEK